ncbi:uncharacterized protein LOC126748582 [Anthonomus grandis grandis]|uniref:uncharacterized protein LOC126748582 n=1 Tax=Anthonomus grandis grandis TaxID=2921223 RepID=UPI0021655471|nr:uncharacterized protein LOC126748582 [Anthonomus grandis grandis]
MFFILQLFIVIIVSVSSQTTSSQNSTTITSHKVNYLGRIVVKEVTKPHNLFIGRCTKNHILLHQERVVLNNDGRSQIFANIRMNVDGNVLIDCVNVYDESPEVLAYPSYAAGGIGHNYVEFNVLTTFGNGFNFFVQIRGHNTTAGA